MVEKITRTKNIQQTPDGTPFVYLDQTLCEVLGFKAKMPVIVTFDIDRQEVCIAKATALEATS